MNEKVDESIVNCLRTAKGSLPLFRNFGLGVTDQVGRIRRSQIQAQISEYYPEITELSVEQTGETTFKVSVRGSYATK